MVNREIFKIIINGNKVSYKDRKMPKPIQMIPLEPRIKKLILTSRNRINTKIAQQFQLTKEEQAEYDTAVKDKINMEKRLAEICKKDAFSQGAKLMKEEDDKDF
jgi:hypothetical protein